MPNWKKVITSGSDAHLNHITASGNISSSGQLLMDNAKFGSDSVTIDGPGGHITASGNISSSGDLQASKLTIVKTGASVNEKLISLTGGAGTEKFSVDEDGDVTAATAHFNSGHITLGTNDGNGIGLLNTGTREFLVHQADDEDTKFFEYRHSGLDVTGNITASGNISASGTIISNEINTIGNITSSVNIKAEGFFTASGNVYLGPGGATFGTSGVASVVNVGGNTYLQHSQILPNQRRFGAQDENNNGYFGKSHTFTTGSTQVVSINSDGLTVSHGNISGSSTSTGSFGHIKIDGTNIKTFISSSAADDGFGSGGGGGDVSLGDNVNFGDITASGDILNTQIVQMTNSSSVINTFNTGSHQTCKYVLQVTSASFIQSSEMLVMQSSSNAFNTEYAQINSSINLLDFTTKVVGENVELIGSSSFISCSVKFNRTLI